MAEVTLSSENIYHGKVIDVRKDTVRFENGDVGTRDIVVHRGASAMVPLTDDNHVLMVRQWRTPAGRELLEIPAGSLNEGENPEICAHRELIEETQFQAGKMEKLFSMYAAPGYSTEVLHIFLATELIPEKGVGDVDEFIEVEKVPLADAIKMIERGQIEDAKTIAGLLAVS